MRQIDGESARCGGEEDGLGKKKVETTLFTPPVPPVNENTLPRLSLPGCSLSPVSTMTVVSSAFMQWSTSKKITKSIVGIRNVIGRCVIQYHLGTSLLLKK